MVKAIYSTNDSVKIWEISNKEWESYEFLKVITDQTQIGNAVKTCHLQGASSQYCCQSEEENMIHLFI